LPKSQIKAVDEERSQSRARVLISVISLVVFSAVGAYRGLHAGDTLLKGLTTIVFYLVFSSAWYAMVRRHPGKHPRRRYVTIFADLAIVTVFLHLGGKHVSTFYPLFLWIIIGNGIRFGERYLVKAVVMGACGFGSVLVFNDFWRANLEVGIGLLVGVIVLPVFFLGVLRRLRHMSELKSELDHSRLVDKAKDQFLATMSHEIRTPMNGVLGMAETLRDTELNTEQRDQLHIITRSVESLLNIINDILDYSKITSNSLTLESVPFDLNQVLEDVYLLLKSTAESKGIRMEFDYPDGAHRHFLGDPTRIRQIAFNLVGNAIKFTKQGSVTISCRVADSDGGGNITLEIRDTGIGIPEDRLAAVFDQFEQADNSTTRQFGGTGLGLAISRQLAIMMGGNVFVESTLGEGSTFAVSFSLVACDQPVTKDFRQSEMLPDYGLRALVVEDNKVNQVVVKKMLQRIGIEVDIAENGLAALEKLESNSYDLVFMDVRMPVMNGYVATETIRARTDGLADIPILALTAEATKSDVKKCLQAGMNVHLSKPLRLADVVEALDSLEILTTTAV